MHKKIKIGLGIATAMTLAASFGSVTSASADSSGNTADVVGVGSDTLQYLGDFLADGDFNGNFGYNHIAKINRVLNFDATASAGGNAVYAAGGVVGAGSNAAGALPSINTVYRMGTFPLIRVNGSGNGIATLIKDNGATETFQYVRASRLPKTAEIANLDTAYPGNGTTTKGVEVFRLATDGMNIANNITTVNAASNGTLNNAANSATTLNPGDPTSCVPPLSTADLAAIYTNVTTYHVFGDIPGYTAWLAANITPTFPNNNCVAEGIVPAVPQSGSGTHDDFLSSILGSSGAAVASTVLVTEEHDPTAITNYVAKLDVNGHPTGKQDILSPFSTGRYNMIQAGYFDHSLDLIKGTSQSLLDSNTIGLTTTGNALDPTTTAVYNYARGLYVIVRSADFVSATPFLPGGSLNWVNTLFGTGTSWAAKASNAALFTSSGVVQAWKDCGQDATTC